MCLHHAIIKSVHSVRLFSFFNVAGLLILGFFAMILLVVYVGAIAVLFLFVVMMFNINAPFSHRNSESAQ